MNTFVLLQVSEQVAIKSAEMAAKDPHGIIITAVSVSVVFFALIILYVAYTFIGKLTSGQIKMPQIKLPSFRKKSAAKTESVHPTPEEMAAIALALESKRSGEVYAAIGLALHQHMNEKVHDNESYVITIKRRHCEKLQN